MELTVTNRSRAYPGRSSEDSKVDEVQYVVLKVCKMPLMARWLSWLERRPVTAEVESSSLFWVVSNELTSLVNCIWIWNLSSAGRASALQAEGHRFEPYRFHTWMDSRVAKGGRL